MISDLIEAALDVARPLEILKPSEFAQHYRHVNTKPFPGPWDNENAPYLVDIMDAPAECAERGLKGVVCMKSAQGGGTEAFGINVQAWMLTHYPGPYLYLTAKDETAEELSRDRWVHVLSTCDPLKKKHLSGKAHGEKLTVKRFTDSKLVLSGARSPNNYISNPYRGVTFDELDAINKELPEGADIIATILERLAALQEGGTTFMHALAHPTVKERGAGQLYYELSDQRRGHVECPHCQKWFPPLWKDVHVLPRDGQTDAQAELDPSCYVLVTPCCGTECTEADRQRMILKVRQISTLSPEAAATKSWIGVHFWQFFMRSKSVRVLAEKYVDALIALKNGDDSKMRVFVNKVCGDCYDTKEKDVTVEIWEKLATPEGEHGSYLRGQVPLEVQWLTSGQDSRLDEFHWAVWGWGLVRDQALPDHAPPSLCGWLVDWGVLPGPRRIDNSRQSLRSEDFFVFDQVLYGQYWMGVDGRLQFPVTQGLHDSGWQPTAVYEYCRSKQGRAFPSKGAAEDDHSSAPPVTWTGAIKWKVGETDFTDPTLKRADLNTFALKSAFFSLTEGSFTAQGGVKKTRISLPRNVDGLMLAHLSAERLIRDERGRRKWVRRGPNHWLDCAIMSYAVALNIHAAMPAETNTDAARQAQAAAREKIRERTPKRRIRTRYQ